MDTYTKGDRTVNHVGATAGLFLFLSIACVDANVLKFEPEDGRVEYVAFNPSGQEL